ncbi:MAG: anthranilate synthase component I [Candidatus Bathyarchaeia archaeon]
MIELPLDYKPFELFTKLCKGCVNAYLLESMEGPEKLAEYSFIGFNPERTVRSRNGVVTVKEASKGKENVAESSDPLEVLRDILKEYNVTSQMYRLIGGAVGYISYDAVRMWERLPDTTVDDLGFPDLEMGVYQDGIVFNHKTNEAHYYYIKENRLDELSRLMEEEHEKKDLISGNPEVNISKDGFEEAVLKAKEYVAAGDIFQVVLSKRYEFKAEGDLCEFYRALRGINPSPYMYYLKMGDRSIIGSSPEMLVRVEGRTVETYPIAGTRPRVEDPAENRLLAEELLSDPKERAEHVMLVDLGRNDIGKVSRFGSVHVPEFMEVHQYSHVQHIVSRVIGELREGCDCYDALRAVFPAGTVSGAPKVRAMEIIEESEPTRRGPYAGAVGYFSCNGNADFAITIRTLVAEGDRCYIQVGGGIVADSVPEREWYETEHKAQALFKALEQSEGSA